MADGCTLSRAGEVAGWRSVVLENDELRVIVLPDKGAEIHQIVDLASRASTSSSRPRGGCGRRARRRCREAATTQFMWNYAGGWQELFPSVNEACAYRGASRSRFTARSPRCRGSTRCSRTTGTRRRPVLGRARPAAVPARARAAPRARRGRRSSSRGRSTNESTERAHFRLGSPSASSGRRSSSRAAGSRSPRARSSRRPSSGSPRRRGSSRAVARRGRTRHCAAGGTVDLREVPGPETGSHDDLYVDATSTRGGSRCRIRGWT